MWTTLNARYKQVRSSIQVPTAKQRSLWGRGIRYVRHTRPDSIACGTHRRSGYVTLASCGLSVIAEHTGHVTTFTMVLPRAWPGLAVARRGDHGRRTTVYSMIALRYVTTFYDSPGGSLSRAWKSQSFDSR